MTTPQRTRSPARPAASAGESVHDDGGDALCSCCEPRNPLVLRPDLGLLADGSAEYALCVLHEPQPVVYRNRGDGLYERARQLSLNPSGEIVDAQGRVLAQVSGDAFQRLATVDDDAPEGAGPAAGGGGGGGPASPGGAARPSTYHVDLSQDDFYRAP